MSAEDTHYAELQVTSNFSFLRGASHAEELVRQSVALGIMAIAMTDRNTLAGVVRAHVAARDHPIQLIIGARLDLTCGNSLLCWPTDRAAYGRLSRLLTLGKTERGAPKGECWIGLADVLEHAEGQLFAAIPPEVMTEEFPRFLNDCQIGLGDRLFVAASHFYRGDDRTRLAQLEALGIPLVATNDVHYHVAQRRALQDVLTCVREKCTIDEAGFRLAANAERHLKPPAEMARLFNDHPEAVANTIRIADGCRFSLDELRYEYPDETTGAGRTPAEELAYLTWEGARTRYPGFIPDKIKAGIDHELALIGQMRYEPYFLTVHDIVRFAESRGILCQGRGSAANSVVCYCLGITAVNPMMTDLLFERFISTARNEPPDIDVDFEHERREEVIQYIYQKYGRDRAGLAATVIRYRSRSAITDVGKALGLSEDTLKRLSGSIWGYGGEEIDDARVREQGLDPDNPRLRMALTLAAELYDFPRHLSQHVGGFVMTRGPLAELCPIMAATMKDRTNIEWDKDDIEALGIMKVDVLALGMLTCIHRAFDLVRAHYGKQLTLWNLPQDDPAVYEMISRADTLGVFQIESRAQMTMLPRLRPKKFYDLVIEVAIVRPGPIQGDMVHPYLRRRNGEEEVIYPSKELEAVLSRTLGVPLFQEQAMKIAIVAAGFTPAEADQLRRAMATFKKVGLIDMFRAKMVEGMIANNYPREFAERCFKQIEGFGTYGFPESHAASFALLVYVSAWIKHYYPDVFAAALLNSQPMGFYAPAQIVRDAREHGVEVREPDINRSVWDCTLEPSPGRHAVRLGLRQIKGASAKIFEKILAARANGYPDLHTLWRRARLGASHLEPLANADAFRSLGLDRRQALWHIKTLEAEALPLFDSFDTAPDDSADALPAMRQGEHVAEDYNSLSLSLKDHPMRFLRPHLEAANASRFPLVPATDLPRLAHHKMISVAGLVLVRQRPGTAKGVMFITIEDETGVINLVVFPDVYEANRRAILTGRALSVVGQLEKAGQPGNEVIHVIVRRMTDITGQLSILTEQITFAPKPRNTSETGSARMIPVPRSFR
jgi:error-prone DNA polymerase